MVSNVKGSNLSDDSVYQTKADCADRKEQWLEIEANHQGCDRNQQCLELLLIHVKTLQCHTFVAGFEKGI